MKKVLIILSLLFITISSFAQDATLYLRKAADSKDPEAMYNLAECFYSGNGGCELSKDLAARWYTEAAEKGYPAAMYKAALCYYYADGVTKDNTKAVTYAKNARKAGVKEVAWLFSRLYKDKILIDNNDYISCLKQAADLHNQEAIREIADLYYFGSKDPQIEKDVRNAISYYSRLENLSSDVVILKRIANIYDPASSSTLNGPLMAADYYKKTIALGDYDCAMRLAQMYSTGIGDLTKNLSEALKYYKIAADNGNSSAMLIVAMMYFNGEGTKKDMNSFFTYLKKSVDAGELSGINKLGVCYRDGIGVNKNDSQAFSLFKRGSDNGDKDASYNLARCYKSGIGVSKNMKNYVDALKVSAERGNIDAMFDLGYEYQMGKNVSANKGDAIFWYNKASAAGDFYSSYVLAICYFYGNSDRVVPKIVTARDDSRALDYASMSEKSSAFNDSPSAVKRRIYVMIQRIYENVNTELSKQYGDKLARIPDNEDSELDPTRIAELRSKTIKSW